MTFEEALDLTTTAYNGLKKMYEELGQELREMTDLMLQYEGETRRQADVIDNMHECNVRLFNDKARLMRENEALRADLRVMSDVLRSEG